MAGHRLVKPVLHGPAYSAYVRVVRLVLEEKGVPYDLREFSILSPDEPPPEHWARHPFGRVPAFSHDGFDLYETAAIARYVDEAFEGPPLQPADPKDRARMNQAVGVIDAYGYHPMVHKVFVQRVLAPRRGAVPDEAVIAAGLAESERCLDALERIAGGQPFLAGPTLTLADLHAAPMLAYFQEAPEGRSLVLKKRYFRDWWSRIGRRQSVLATRSILERNRAD